MSVDIVISLMLQALKVALLVSAPLLLAGLIVGLIVSIFQAVTQIQEMTLSFIPKILAIMISLGIFFPWMMQLTITYTRELLMNMNVYIGKI